MPSFSVVQELNHYAAIDAGVRLSQKARTQHHHCEDQGSGTGSAGKSLNAKACAPDAEQNRNDQAGEARAAAATSGTNHANASHQTNEGEDGVDHQRKQEDEKEG